MPQNYLRQLTMLRFVLLFLGHKHPVVYINSVEYMIKKRKNPKFEFTNERLTYFMKFTIQHVVYVIKQSVSPEMFTKEIVYYSAVYYWEIPLYIHASSTGLLGCQGCHGNHRF